MPTLTVTLPHPVAAFIESVIARGDYASETDVVLDALRLLSRETASHEHQVAELRAALDRGLASVDAGRFSSRSIEDIRRAVAAEDDVRR